MRLIKNAGKRRENVIFVFTSDWIRWREIFKPITKRSDANPKQMCVAFDTQGKSALWLLTKIGVICKTPTG